MDNRVNLLQGYLGQTALNGEALDFYPEIKREETEILGIKVAVTIVTWILVILVHGRFCGDYTINVTLSTDKFVEAQF